MAGTRPVADKQVRVRVTEFFTFKDQAVKCTYTHAHRAGGRARSRITSPLLYARPDRAKTDAPTPRRARQTRHAADTGAAGASHIHHKHRYAKEARYARARAWLALPAIPPGRTAPPATLRRRLARPR